MGVREALWLVGLALVCYSVWQFFRALRAPRSMTAPPPGVAGPAGAESPRAAEARAALPGGEEGRGRGGDQDEDDQDGDDDSFEDYAPLPRAGLSPGTAPAQTSSDAVPMQTDPSRPDIFQLELDNSRLRQALQAQRDLVALQQNEIDRLVQDINALQDELERVRDQPTSSPEYSEAMVLAAQGLNAEMIAARCGITLAEAELVLSLARRGEGAA